MHMVVCPKEGYEKLKERNVFIIKCIYQMKVHVFVPRMIVYVDIAQITQVDSRHFSVSVRLHKPRE